MLLMWENFCAGIIPGLYRDVTGIVTVDILVLVHLNIIKQRALDTSHITHHTEGHTMSIYKMLKRTP